MYQLRNEYCYKIVLTYVYNSYAGYISWIFCVKPAEAQLVRNHVYFLVFVSPPYIFLFSGTTPVALEKCFYLRLSED